MSKKRIKPKEGLLKRYRRAQDVAIGIDTAKEVALPLLIKHTLRKTLLTGMLAGMVLLRAVEVLVGILL
jgi:hypothetical protein